MCMVAAWTLGKWETVAIHKFEYTHSTNTWSDHNFDNARNMEMCMAANASNAISRYVAHKRSRNSSTQINICEWARANGTASKLR